MGCSLNQQTCLWVSRVFWIKFIKMEFTLFTCLWYLTPTLNDTFNLTEHFIKFVVLLVVVEVKDPFPSYSNLTIPGILITVVLHHFTVTSCNFYTYVKNQNMQTDKICFNMCHCSPLDINEIYMFHIHAVRNIYMYKTNQKMHTDKTYFISVYLVVCYISINIPLCMDMEHIKP
jgi:hypothetical protein